VTVTRQGDLVGEVATRASGGYSRPIGASDLAMYQSRLVPRTQRRAALVAVFFLGVLPFPLAAQETGNSAEGKHLAEMWCSSCHVITPTAAAKGRNGVPTFAAVARRPSTTPASLRTSFLRPHPEIQNMHATPDEIRDLTAYIMSLRGP
jgi:cytochrome c